MANEVNLEKVSIHNGHGQFIFSTNTSQVDLKDLATGIYIVEKQTNRGKFHKKIIIE